MHNREKSSVGVSDYQGPHLHIPLDFVDWGELSPDHWYACDLERMPAAWESLECRVEGIKHEPHDYNIEIQLFGYRETFEIPSDGVITVHVPWGYLGLTAPGSDFRMQTCAVLARDKNSGWGTFLDRFTVSAYRTKADVPDNPPWRAGASEAYRAVASGRSGDNERLRPWHEIKSSSPATRARRRPLPAGAPRVGTYENGGYFFGITVDQDGTPYKNYVAPRAYEMFGPLVDKEFPSNAPDYPLRQCLDRTNSRANTERLRESSRLAAVVCDLTIDGFGGWAIPAVDVAELLYRNMHTGYRPSDLQPKDGDNGRSLPDSLPPYWSGDANHPTYYGYPETTVVDAFKRFGPEAFDHYTTCHISTVAWANTPLDVYESQLYVEFGGSPRRHGSPGVNEFALRPVRREKFNR